MAEVAETKAQAKNDKEQEYVADITIWDKDLRKTVVETAKGSNAPRKIMVAVDESSYSKVASKWAKDNLVRPDDFVLLMSVWEAEAILKLGDEAADQTFDTPPKMNNHSKHLKLGKCLLENPLTPLKPKGQQKGQEKVFGFLQSEVHPNPKAIGQDLVDMAKEIGADVIVCGTRGLGAIKGALLGSVSSFLSHNAPCAVVIVPSEPST